MISNFRIKSKQEVERAYFDQFRQLYNEIPHGKIIQSESPDFIIRSRHFMLGVEITRIYQENIIEVYSETIPSIISKAVFLSALHPILEKKESKRLRYQTKRMNSNWLVIVFVRESANQPYNFLKELDNTSVESGFEKVFLLDVYANQLIELKS